MFRLLRNSEPLCDGVSRREILRMGVVGLGGLKLPQLLHSQARASGKQRRAKSVIVLFNGGSIPHHETFDPKPDVHEEIRGAFGSIPTRTPGLRVGELMPRTASITNATRPATYLATVFHCLGIDGDATIPDVEGRPVPVYRGRVLNELLR